MADIVNKKASFDYELLERFEAGAALFGFEVKAIRRGMGSLEGARIIVRGGEAYLIGATVNRYQQANTPKSYDPERPRKLLLHKKQIEELAGAEAHKGLTIVPIKWYNNKQLVKLSLAIARGKKKADKREIIKKRETDREIARTLRRGR